MCVYLLHGHAYHIEPMSICVHPHTQRALHMCVHVCRVCSALSSVSEKFIRRPAVPEGMGSAVVFPAPWSSMGFCCFLPASPQPPREMGCGRGFEPIPHVQCSVPHPPGLLLYPECMSQVMGEGSAVLPLDPADLTQSQGPAAHPGAPPPPSSLSSSWNSTSANQAACS